MLLLVSLASASSFDAAFDRAEAETGVPAELLQALAWEASRMDPSAASAWGGYGLFDFREDDESHGPGIERVATLLDRSPDEIMASPELQILGAAELLAWHADLQLGERPEDLEGWTGPLAAFSGRMEPALQAMFVAYVYEVVAEGVYDPTLKLHPHPVDLGAVHDHFELAYAPPASTDYAGAAQFKQAHSSNYSDYSRSAADIDYVIIHTVQGSYSGCISWFQNSAANVSAHYVVRSSDGQVTQMLLEEDVGWHAGNWTYNAGSVGIEHEGYVDEPSTWYTTAMYEESAKLTADIARRNSIPVDRSHIIAHYEVPGATHTDPGTGWDWSRYMDLVGGGDSPSASAEMLGVVADGDIYSGERLVGVKVTLVETGDVVYTGDDGWYTFDGLPAGSYTARAEYSGYQTAECAKTIDSGSGQWWCSIAMEPGEDPVDTGTDDTGSVVDSGTDDTGELVEDLPAGRPPGESTEIASLGTGCATGGMASGFWLLGLLALRRRR